MGMAVEQDVSRLQRRQGIQMKMIISQIMKKVNT